ncbi:MAG: ribonuclease D [Gammaproteobacteria bacterium]|nr:ribonuclease D [Gammaproteobacteria bacterium]
MDCNYQYIDTDSELVKISNQLRSSTFLSVDTEFIRERTYYPQLCLIQIANEDLVACIDPIAIKNLDPLRDLLLTPDILKVFHAAHQDMEIFYHLWGELPKPVYDSQIAATLLGFGESIGYASLVKQVLGMDVDKSHTRTDWSRRPLSPEQLQYAADDVRHLATLYPLQKSRLETLGRLEWLSRDFINLSDPIRYAPDPENMWRKVKGVNKLKRRQLAVLQALAAWREEQAMKLDRPRRRIVSDEVLVDLARLQPGTLSDFSQHRGIPAVIVKTYGEVLLDIIKAGQKRPESSWPSLPSKPSLTPDQEAISDALAALVKLISAQTQISSASLATHKELESLVRGDRNLNVLQGWREQYVGKRLLDFLEGESSLSVDKGKLDLNSLKK